MALYDVLANSLYPLDPPCTSSLAKVVNILRFPVEIVNNENNALFKDPASGKKKYHRRRSRGGAEYLNSRFGVAPYASLFRRDVDQIVSPTPFSEQSVKLFRANGSLCP